MLGGVVVNILREHKLRGMLEDVHIVRGGGCWFGWEIGSAGAERRLMSRPNTMTPIKWE